MGKKDFKPRIFYRLSLEKMVLLIIWFEH